jgi:BirA family biotin operon repressor/biotin-[acetyl-CoA-carboxylase] ligase
MPASRDTAAGDDAARRVAEEAELRVRRRLARDPAGTRFADVHWVAQTGSTNSDLLARARDGASEGVVLVSDHQSAGRGRQDRRWVAPPGSSLLLSVLLRPPAVVAGASTMAVGVALVEAVEEITGLGAGLKWPNDLVVPVGDHEAGPDRKLAGILAEADWPVSAASEPKPDERLVVVVGAGLNVSWPAELPDELADTAIALNHVLGRDVDRMDLLVAFLRRLEATYGSLVRDRSAGRLVETWRQRSATLGRRVRVDLGADDVEGRAVDVTEDGRLVLDTDEGTRRTFAVGDVIHLRPVGG